MLCDVCHKNIATVHLTEIINKKVVELHICQKCTSLKTEELKHQLNLSDFLAGLVGKPFSPDKTSLRCPLCGLTLKEFKKQGRLGCSKCYLTFREHLLPLLRKMHGSTKHVGKLPRSVKESITMEQRANELNERLLRAVELEEYEEAAKIRDKIKKIEKTRKEKHSV